MKRYKSIVVMMICIIMLCACGKESEGLEAHPEFVGKWQCAEAPLEHPDYYTGYLMWVINEDGSFTMYDAEAGNPGIRGNMQIVSDTELEFVCDTEEDFDPPVTWESMEETQVVSYKFTNDTEIQVTFASDEGDSTLVFSKAE